MQLTGLADIQSDVGPKIHKQKFTQALVAEGNGLLRNQNKLLLVRLCMANLYGLVSSLKDVNDQSVFNRQALVNLKPGDKKVSTRMKCLQQLPSVLMTKYRESDAAEVLMLIILGQMVICDASGRVNPNLALAKDLSDKLAKSGFDMGNADQGVANRQLVIDRLREKGLRINPSISQNIPMLESALRANITLFSNVEVCDLDGALERFASELTASIADPSQKASMKNYVIQLLKQTNPMFPNTQDVGQLMMKLGSLMPHFPDRCLAYEMIKAIVTSQNDNLVELFMEQGVSLNEDDIKQLDSLLANQETEVATKQALNQVFARLSGDEREVCMDVAIEEMDFIPQVSGSGASVVSLPEHPPQDSQASAESVLELYMEEMLRAYSQQGSVNSFIRKLYQEELVSDELYERYVSKHAQQKPSSAELAESLVFLLKAKLNGSEAPVEKVFSAVLLVLQREPSWQSLYQSMKQDYESGKKATLIIRKHTESLKNIFSSNLHGVVNDFRGRGLLTKEECNMLLSPGENNFQVLRHDLFREIEEQVAVDPEKLQEITAVMKDAGMPHHKKLAEKIEAAIQ
ncbi:hypothetical protein [Parendozoicomonas haliclonae]|nr:hypothetical protein [Parendozoicomonas haliclonae]